jgi:hypothetical protein
MKKYEEVRKKTRFQVTDDFVKKDFQPSQVGEQQFFPPLMHLMPTVADVYRFKDHFARGEFWLVWLRARHCP